MRPEQAHTTWPGTIARRLRTLEKSMSRIGKRPIPVPSGVTVTPETDGTITVKGPKGTLVRRLNPEITYKHDNGSLIVERPSDAKQHRSLHGLTRTLVSNMVEGVTK